MTEVSSAARVATRRYAETPVQKAALAVGIVFIFVGASGFIPGITTHDEQLRFLGSGSHALLAGVFQISVLQNIIYLVFGVGVLMARTESWSRGYLLGGGLLFGAMGVYGIAVHQRIAPNFVPFNPADTWLHVALFFGLLALGFLPPTYVRRTRTTPPSGA